MELIWAAAGAGVLLLGGGLATIAAARRRRPSVVASPRALRRRARREEAWRAAIVLAAAACDTGRGLDPTRLEALQDGLARAGLHGAPARVARLMRAGLEAPRHDDAVRTHCARLRQPRLAAHRATVVALVHRVVEAGGASLSERRASRRIAAALGVPPPPSVSS